MFDADDEKNVNSKVAPVWQLPISGAEKTGNSYVSMKAKYHCFVDDVSLCGRYHQFTDDYDYGITTDSGAVLEAPQFACKKCLEVWKKQYNVEV